MTYPVPNPAWPRIEGIAYGGDYTPEQWSPETWIEDVTLMREAGVNLVSVGMFTWALLEPRPGEFHFEWLDEVIDLLHANGIRVDLGTPTASPPAWFFAENPDARVVNRDGVSLGFGSRGIAAPSSPAYLEASVRIASALAHRYGSHPAVVLWHVHNEYGAPVSADYSAHSQTAFRRWLQSRYTSLERLNVAWGTTFWGQRYGDWEHVDVPRTAPTEVNPAQRLDFARFMDWQLRECFIAERDAIRRHAPQPITTNFMANQIHVADMWKWGAEVDIVSNDNYLWAADEDAEIGLSIAADLTRSVARGRPWILMEHSTSAVNWQPRNIAKRPGEMSRNSFSHLARGADAILFFQWRASRFGAEKFHSAMIPHAGTDSRVWREVVELGSQLKRLSELRDTSVHAEVAMIWDFDSIWAQGIESGPSVDIDAVERIRAYYEVLWRSGVTVDFALPGHDLTSYRVVIMPAQYLLTEADAQNLADYVARGGILVTSYFSAVVDADNAVHRGGFGAPLHDLFGLSVEEFLPLRENQTASIRWVDGDPQTHPTAIWQEHVNLRGAEAVALNVGGPADALPAITRHPWKAGVAWYVSTHIEAPAIDRLLRTVWESAGLTARAPGKVEVVERRGDAGRYTFVINHSDSTVSVSATGRELITNEDLNGTLQVVAGGVAVMRGHS